MSCKLKVSPANVSAQPAPAPAVTLPPSARRPLSDPKKQTDEAASAAPAEDRVLRIFELTHERMPAFAARLKELKPGLVFAGTAGDTSGKKLGVLARAQEMEQIAALIGKLDVPAQPGAAAPLAVAPPAAAPLAEVAASAISPDGRRMALATKDDVMLLDTQTGRLLARTTGGAGAGPVRAVAFSPDGKLIASGSHGGTVALLDSATGKVLRQAKVGRPITIVVFTPDGATLTITTTDMVQHLLDMITGTLKRGADETKPRR
jgi:glucose/arabinose dehydrogenase